MMKKKPIILIADDDADHLFLLGQALRKKGYEVMNADNQAAAERAIEETRPDLAVFDLMMDTHDSGFILCRRMKRKHPGVPVILLTGLAAETGLQLDPQDQASGWIQADLVLDKGLRFDDLTTQIEQMIPKS